MTIPISFYYDEKGYPKAKTSNTEEYDLFCWFLEADLQSPTSCAGALSIIQEFEEGDGEKWGGIGNLMLLELEGQRARVYIGMLNKDSGDYGEPNEMSIADLKQLIRSWQAHLLKKQK
jgi:hypothetical protein